MPPVWLEVLADLRETLGAVRHLALAKVARTGGRLVGDRAGGQRSRGAESGRDLAPAPRRNAPARAGRDHVQEDGRGMPLTAAPPGEMIPRGAAQRMAAATSACVCDNVQLRPVPIEDVGFNVTSVEFTNDMFVIKGKVASHYVTLQQIAEGVFNHLGVLAGAEKKPDGGMFVRLAHVMVVYTCQTCEHVSQDFDLVPAASQDRGFSLGTWPVSGASANADEAAPSLDT